MTAWRSFTAAAALVVLAAMPGLAADTDSSTSARPPGWGMMGGAGYGPMMGYGCGGGFAYGRGSFGMGPWMMSAMWGFGDEDAAVGFIDGRLAFVKAELKVTDRQMPEWNAFATTMRANAKAINEQLKPLRAGRWAAKPLPERLEEQAKVMAARVDAFNRTSEAVKPLYAVLDDAQKKIADVILLGPMGGFSGPF